MYSNSSYRKLATTRTPKGINRDQNLYLMGTLEGGSLFISVGVLIVANFLYDKVLTNKEVGKYLKVSNFKNSYL